MSEPAPLIERDSELAAIDGPLARAAAGVGSVLLITGEAGVGKSSLTRAVAQVAGERGARVLLAACDDLLTSRALGPINDLADRSTGALRAALANPADREGLLDALRSELTDRPLPVLLVIEDAHWIDDATVDVLIWLTRRIESFPVLLVLTYRSDEVTGTHALMRVLGRLGGVPVLRLPLHNLTPDAIAELIRANRSGGVSVDEAELYKRTGGNPFFVTEILANPSMDVPPTVTEAVLARVRRLSGPTQHALQQLSVLPGGAEHPDLDALVREEQSLDPVAALAEAEAAGMVVVTPRRITFRHELARQGLLGALPAALVRHLHRRVIAMLLSKNPPDPSLLLHHAAAIGDRDVLVRLGPQAARDAAASGAHRQAAEHFRRVLNEPDAVIGPDRADLLEGYAQECYLISDAPAAVAAQQQAVDLRERGIDRVALGNALRRLSRLLWYAGQDRPADEVAEQALEVLEDAGDAVALAWAHSNAAQLAMLASRDEEAGRRARIAVELAMASGDQAVLAHALNNLGIARWREDGPQQGAGLLAESLRISLAEHLEDDACRAYVNLIGGYLDDPDYPAAERLLVEALEFAGNTEQLAFLRFLQTHQATVLLHTGRWSAAVAAAQEALAGAPVASSALALAIVAAVRVRTGDDAAPDVLDALIGEVRGADSLQRLLPVAVVRAEHAWLSGRATDIPALIEHAWVVAQDRRHAAAFPAQWDPKLGIHVT